MAEEVCQHTSSWKKKNIFGIYSFPKGLSIDSNQQYFPAFHQEHLNTHNIANSFLYDYQAQEKKKWGCGILFGLSNYILLMKK